MPGITILESTAVESVCRLTSQLLVLSTPHKNEKYRAHFSREPRLEVSVAFIPDCCSYGIVISESATRKNVFVILFTDVIGNALHPLYLTKKPTCKALVFHDAAHCELFSQTRKYFTTTVGFFMESNICSVYLCKVWIGCLGIPSSF